METPSYIKSLLIPNGKKATGRRVWSIDLETVWLPFFTATNTVGDTRIPHEALGAPLRLAYDPDGSVKFSKTGRPVVKVVKDLADVIRTVRENFTAGLQNYAEQVVTENPEGYQAEVEQARRAGEPIVVNDRQNLQQAMLKAMEQAVAEAEAKAMTEPVAKQGEAEPEARKPKGKVPVPA